MHHVRERKAGPQIPGFGDVGSLANIIAQVFAALLPVTADPASVY